MYLTPGQLRSKPACGFLGGWAWSLESHLITVAALQDDPRVDLEFWERSRAVPGTWFSQQVIIRRKKQEHIGTCWEENPCGILEGMYIVGDLRCAQGGH